MTEKINECDVWKYEFVKAQQQNYGYTANVDPLQIKEEIYKQIDSLADTPPSEKDRAARNIEFPVSRISNFYAIKPQNLISGSDYQSHIVTLIKTSGNDKGERLKQMMDVVCSNDQSVMDAITVVAQGCNKKQFKEGYDVGNTNGFKDGQEYGYKTGTRKAYFTSAAIGLVLAAGVYVYWLANSDIGKPAKPKTEQMKKTADKLEFVK